MAKNTIQTSSVIGVKELRQNLEKYAKEVSKGKSFTVFRRSTPLFRITAPDEESVEAHWELIADFTEIDPKGVPISDIIAALE